MSLAYTVRVRPTIYNSLNCFVKFHSFHHRCTIIKIYISLLKLAVLDFILISPFSRQRLVAKLIET